ncbi:TRAP transporter substrate-binding protein DctP [uncultured Oscillibacter sp.]|uniref:TRAP transporter substrate-binding protein DctP n=1 Tax=uncultured Oscillibacter sp. TaxID=876091 RepID=UPI003434882F
MSVGAFFLIFFAVLFFGLPIAGCFGFMTILPNLVSDSFPVDAMMAVRTMANGLNSFTLLAIPLFVLAGIIMARGGISEKLFNFFAYFIGNKTAGYPCAVVATCLFYGAISGSAPATTAAVGSMTIPLLTRLGYDKKFTVALVAIAGGLGVIIPPSIAAWEALGAAPTPMDWGEVYVGLQQKMIDGVEQPYFSICSSKLYEVQDYMLETNHIAQPAALFMSEKVYQGLPAEIQALIDDCSEIATQKTRETTDSMMADRLQEIKDHGVEVSQVTPELLAEMRERVAPATELIKQDVGEEFFNAYAAARDAAR